MGTGPVAKNDYHRCLFVAMLVSQFLEDFFPIIMAVWRFLGRSCNCGAHTVASGIHRDVLWRQAKSNVECRVVPLHSIDAAKRTRVMKK